MIPGIIAGFTWGIDTVVLGLALSMAPFCSTEQAVLLAPFVSTFLHDFFSCIWATLFNLVRGNIKNVWKALVCKSGKWVVIAAVIGGPIGMTGYVLSINYMGASVGALASAVFPAIGAVLAYIFLKEKMKWYQWVFLVLTIAGIYGLSYTPGDGGITNFLIGLIGTLACAVGWGVEAVIIAHAVKDPEVKDEYALQIRQTTSCLVYGIILLPILNGWGFTVSLFNNTGWLVPFIVIAALFGTGSYLCYYKAITNIGAAKSMALNVTYAAWALIFTVIITGDASILTPLTIICAIVVLVCGIFAAANFKELFEKRKKE